jgi:superfamily II DNA or RNA helicase
MVFDHNDSWPETTYNSKINNVVTEFFIPALKNSTTYRRIAGLFSSNSFALAARGIRELIANQGKMDLIISPILSKEDAEAISNASIDDFQKIISKSIIIELDSIESEFEKDHVGALLYLLKNDFLEIRIHVPKDEFGNILDSQKIIEQNILSEKRGIFQDRNGKAISFRGPINANRDSWEKGDFSITVDVSWISGQEKHVKDDIDIFNRLWDDSNTYKLPDLTRTELIKIAPEKNDITLEKYDVPPWARLHNGRTLWNNQIRAVNAWTQNNYRGIFTIATSGGKTLASLAASSLTPKNVLVVIIVHGLQLVTQWEKEISLFDPKANLTICDSEHVWREKLGLVVSQFFESSSSTPSNRFYVLANDSTANDNRDSPIGFLQFFRHVDSKKIMIIADEVHHLGASKNQQIFKIQSDFRLGLSATFIRQWDEEGTQIIRDYFGDELVDAKYSVKDGIRDGRLCKYIYRPFFAILEPDEFDEYNEKTIDIGIKMNQLKKDPENEKIKKDLNMLTNLRADIIKKAKNKKKAYREIIRMQPNSPYIVFLDDNEQLEEFRKEHNRIIDELNQNSEEPIKKDILVFDGNTKPWQRQIILEQSVDHKTPIFSMYCLDEGIDVPEFQGAILISSASSERQYIQRRGRILRGAIFGKIAELFDIVVLPNSQESIVMMDSAENIIKKELKRVEEISQDAINAPEVKNIVNSELKKLGFSYII